MPVRIDSNNANEYKQSSSSKYGSMDSSRELNAFAGNLKMLFEFCLQNSY